MRSSARKVLTAVLALFIFPLAVHAALYASKDHPASYRVADWSSVGMLPPATTDRDARLLVFTGRPGRWKGIFAVHSWVVLKPGNAVTWSRYAGVGWGGGWLGVKVGWVEGVELNFFGLVAGLDLRPPALKLPGFGRLGMDDGTAVAAPAPGK